MKKFTEFNVTYKLIIAGLSSALSAVLIDFLMKKFDDRAISMLFLFSVIIVMVLILNYFVEKVIDGSERVRKRISGDDYIEGYWYDVSIDAENSKVVHGVLIRIQYVDGIYQINGATYSPLGQHVATFRSRRSVYSNRVLFCEYESQTEYFKTAMETGIMKLHFDSPPTSYTGIYFDYTGKLNCFIRGLRVSDKIAAQNNNFKTPESKRDFIVNIIAHEQDRLGLEDVHGASKKLKWPANNRT